MVIVVVMLMLWRVALQAAGWVWKPDVKARRVLRKLEPGEPPKGLASLFCSNQIWLTTPRSRCKTTVTRAISKCSSAEDCNFVILRPRLLYSTTLLTTKWQHSNYTKIRYRLSTLFCRLWQVQQSCPGRSFLPWRIARKGKLSSVQPVTLDVARSTAVACHSTTAHFTE